ncbi:DNA recombination protein RmuC [Pseudoalteromonas luteoviolacea]|uniref:DNA recombination protein RmuC n=1 Tax=Pseudoalteromonas luteoviolacea TaxID=43657 RepID=UPI001B3A6D88|nr:DNA recombination protein RmuC [Pseudoalteromonas luteoviolacea]MBQ4877867.1 DNA recombination protein RmuC [Pseudoalteromonas luteoviolacea]MBQ4906902.1 DNA recombination protein RmuC [Pseudoalteromonas luteoviolacea]
MLLSGFSALSWQTILVLLGLGTTISSIGFFIIIHLSKQKARSLHEMSQAKIDSLQQAHDELKDNLNTAQQLQLKTHGEAQQYQARLAEKHAQVKEYYGLWQQAQNNAQQSQEEAHQLALQLTDMEAKLSEKQLAFDAQIAQLEQAKHTLKQEFENVASKLFEEKSQQFARHSQEKIQTILSPVQGEIKGFRDKMEAIHSEELKQRAALKTELLHLQANNQAMTDQASKLTTALQGQTKTQGNWGELMLENVLDSAGLRPGYDYKREVSFTTSEGKYRPDVIVYLPQSRHLVVDAKTSLNAYTRYVNAQDEVSAQQAIKEHVGAVKARVKELGDKSYERLPGLNSPEVVIMFIPVESAFVEAIKYEPDIYQYALENKVLVATPTTLLTSLNIVKQLWRFEEQSKHSKELALRAEKFYNKLNSFLHSLEGVGKQLDKAQETYDKAVGQLYTGKGNLIKQASEFKELGVSVTKELPEEMLEKAKLELK